MNVTNPIWNDQFLHGQKPAAPAGAAARERKHGKLFFSSQENAAPMFQFALPGALFTLQYRAPSLRPLFTLPPTSSARPTGRADQRHLCFQSEIKQNLRF